jgi:hypothetical protein
MSESAPATVEDAASSWLMIIAMTATSNGPSSVGIW